MAIKLRRGNWVDFDPNKLVESELALVLDRGELYFCYAPGQVKRLQTREDLEELLNTSPETLNALEEIISELAEAPEEVLEILAHFMDIEEIIEAAEEATQRANNISDDLQYKLDTNYFKGEKGDPGDRGVNWRGTYSSSETYYQYDGVSFNGSSYICIVESTQGNAPTDSTKWDILANKGADGLGTGDMLKSVYDPQGKEQDIFEYADTKIPLAEKGEPGGVATLDEDGKVPDEQLPPFDADNISYDNTDSGLDADKVKDAIDELQANKINKTDIVQTAEVNDANKVPSSAVTHNLAQSLNELNNNLEYKTYTPFAGCTHMCRGNVATIQVAGAITAENGQQTTIGSVTQWFPKQNIYGIVAVNGGASGKFCLVTIGTSGNIIVYNYSGVKVEYLYFTITYVF